MSLVLGFTGFKIERIQPAEAQAATAPTVLARIVARVRSGQLLSRSNEVMLVGGMP